MLWKFVGALTLFRLLYIALIPITPQEAYYWLYAQFPALGYFDHPPMAAYSILLGTSLFGDSVFGVKLMGVVWSAASNILLYFTILQAPRWSLILGKSSARKVAIYGVILYNLTSFSHIYAISIMPDTPLIFFWLLTIFFVQRWFIEKKSWYWLLAGASLGLAMLSKYTAFMVLPGIVLYLLIDSRYRSALFSLWPWLGLLLAAAVFSPVIFWNANHEWASFLFQFGDRAEAASRFRPHLFGQLIASQMAILTPLLFVLLLKVPWDLWRKKISHGAPLFFFLSGIFLIAAFVYYSFWSLVKMNWLLPGYMSLIPALALLSAEKSERQGWLFRGSAIFSLLLILFAHLMLLIPNFPLGEGNTWSGWPEAAPKIEKLQQERGGEKALFLFANSYKYAAQTQFYLKDNSQRVYAQNIYGRPALQFDYWPLPESLIGKDALYIIADRREYKDDLKYVESVFDSVWHEQDFVSTFNGKSIRKISLYYAKNYHGISK